MKTNYLQAMDIVSWRLRGPSRQQPAEIYCYRLVTGAGEYTGVLIAEGKSSEERELFAAIRRALKIKTVEYEWGSAPQLLLFGADLASRYQSPATTVTHSLAEMLDNPQLKAKVWQDLKNFSGLLKNI